MILPIYVHSGAENSGPNLVQSIISAIVSEQYFSMATLTALVYHSSDHEVTTMNEEVEYFWPNPWNRISVIYFANRYNGLLGAICTVAYYGFKENLALCRFADWTQGIANFATIFLIDYILLIRVLAFYRQNRKLEICLKILLALEGTADLGILFYSILNQEVTVVRLAVGVAVCGNTRVTPVTLSIISWSIPLAYGLFLLILALHGSVEYWQLSRGFKGLHLVGVLIRDQVLYYVLITFCCVLRIVDIRLTLVNPFISTLLNTAGSATLLCILGGQLLFNLKEARESGANPGTCFGMKSLTESTALDAHE